MGNQAERGGVIFRSRKAGRLRSICDRVLVSIQKVQIRKLMLDKIGQLQDPVRYPSLGFSEIQSRIIHTCSYLSRSIVSVGVLQPPITIRF